MNSNFPMGQERIDDIIQREEYLTGQKCPKCDRAELFKTTTMWPDGRVAIAIDCDGDDCGYGNEMTEEDLI